MSNHFNSPCGISPFGFILLPDSLTLSRGKSKEHYDFILKKI